MEKDTKSPHVAPSRNEHPFAFLFNPVPGETLPLTFMGTMLGAHIDTSSLMQVDGPVAILNNAATLSLIVMIVYFIHGIIHNIYCWNLKWLLMFVASLIAFLFFYEHQISSYYPRESFFSVLLIVITWLWSGLLLVAFGRMSRREPKF